MTFGEYLKQKRLDKEITLRGFAKLVDISPVYLCDLEKAEKRLRVWKSCKKW